MQQEVRAAERQGGDPARHAADDMPRFGEHRQPPIGRVTSRQVPIKSKPRWGRSADARKPPWNKESLTPAATDCLCLPHSNMRSCGSDYHGSWTVQVALGRPGRASRRSTTLFWALPPARTLAGRTSTTRHRRPTARSPFPPCHCRHSLLRPKFVLYAPRDINMQKCRSARVLLTLACRPPQE